MSSKQPQKDDLSLGNDDFSFFNTYIDPSWATIEPASAEDSAFNFGDFSAGKDVSNMFMEPLNFDLTAFLPQPLDTEQTSIAPKDIFNVAQPLLTASNDNATTKSVTGPTLDAFASTSASPEDTTSPSYKGDEVSPDPQSDSESDDSDDQEEFMSRKPSASKRKLVGAGTRGKRAANKPKPYPRVSDVVRDAPHKLDSKKHPASTELKGSVRTADAADDDWRPTMEEYQRMSSKEKRQLRNKISARNFRVRRKEYITTLEGEVAVRDQQLETYREELSTTKSENSQLRQEIERLRKAILEGREGAASIFEKPVSTDSKVGIFAQANSSAKARASKTTLPRPNRNKDLPSSGSARGFWGGSTLGGGTTSVHTTLVPDFDISALSGKSRLQENINPLMNSSNINEGSSSANLFSLASAAGFDPLGNFTFKTIDTDRMHLWTKVAREAGAAQANKEKSLSPASTSSSLGSSHFSSPTLALASSNVGPHYFATPTTTALRAASNTAMQVVKTGDKTLVAGPTEAALAASLSQGLVSKLSGAFWDAFAPKAPNPKLVDIDKVKRVLEGKAELRVVDVEGSNSGSLEESLKAMSLSGATVTAVTPSSSIKMSNSIDALEEGLKGMALCRKEAAAHCTAATGIFKHPMRAGNAPAPVHSPTTTHAVTVQH